MTTNNSSLTKNLGDYKQELAVLKEVHTNEMEKNQTKMQSLQNEYVSQKKQLELVSEFFF